MVPSDVLGSSGFLLSLTSFMHNVVSSSEDGEEFALDNEVGLSVLLCPVAHVVHGVG